MDPKAAEAEALQEKIWILEQPSWSSSRTCPSTCAHDWLERYRLQRELRDVSRPPTVDCDCDPEVAGRAW